jgi:aspartate aminotransferase
VSQAAAVAALNGDQSCVAEMAKAYRARHDLIIKELNGVSGFECRRGEGTFYAFPRVLGAMDARNMKNDVELVEYLLNEADIACVPGSAFGSPGYLRFSFACSIESLEESIRRIKRAMMG